MVLRLCSVSFMFSKRLFANLSFPCRTIGSSVAVKNMASILTLGFLLWTYLSYFIRFSLISSSVQPSLSESSICYWMGGIHIWLPLKDFRSIMPICFVSWNKEIILKLQQFLRLPQIFRGLALNSHKSWSLAIASISCLRSSYTTSLLSSLFWMYYGLSRPSKFS